MKVVSVTKSKVKSTAVGVAAMRAMGAQERDPSVRNPDYLAIRLLPPGLRILLGLRPLARLVLRQYHRTLPGAYYFHIARTKHIDAIVTQSAAQGIRQLVILGAGLDTRAYRLHDVLKDVKVYEVDYPGTQEKKRACAAKLADIPRAGISYVPLDFNIQGLDALLASGYSPSLATLFIWEGVCMYLTPEAVDKVLEFIRDHAAPESSIVFDYIFKGMVEGRCDYYGARESSRYVAKRGEPYTFGIEEGTAREFLAARGFRLASEFTPDMLERAYLTGSGGRTTGKVYGYTNIVHARVGPVG
ncbi:MAG: SAM-dependent methyltransferase [Chloroflexi bacterium]|nr:SAM-dependent methyltransferase [Chloroflexota bacterium]